VLAGDRGGLLGAEGQPRGEGVDGAGEAEEEREAGDPGHEEEADGEGDGAAQHERHRRAEEHGRRRGRRHRHRRPRLPRWRGVDDGEEQRAELADLARVVLAAAGTRHAFFAWLAGLLFLEEEVEASSPFDSRSIDQRRAGEERMRGAEERRGGREQDAGQLTEQGGDWRVGQVFIHRGVGPAYCSPVPQPGPRKLQVGAGRWDGGLVWTSDSLG